MLRIIIILTFLAIAGEMSAQNWKRTRAEISGGIGATNFLGDLGGSSAEGGNYGPKDLDWSTTRYAINLAYRYYVRRNMAAKVSFTYARVSGDDKYSNNPTRNSRGLNFKSPIVELSAQYEYYFLSERTKGMYRLRGSRGLRKLKFDGYVFAGIGLFYFNPKGQLNGEWYALQPLGTEGQTAGNGSKYSRIQGCVPMGIGFKKKINREFSIGFEFGVRMTTTDYIDDVSGNYYEYNKIKAANGDQGDIAAQLSNPNEYNNWPSVTYNQDGTISEFQQRGDDSNNDTYMFALISLHYKIAQKRRSLPKF